MVRTGSAFAAGNLDLWTYNARNELTGSVFYNDTDPCAPANPVTANDRAYAYDPIGNRTAYTEGTAATLKYCANELNQYTATTTDEPHTCPPANAVETFAYDADGNLTQDGRFKYTWNAENRLTRVEPKGGPVAGDKRLTFAYDYRGRRVRKTVETFDGSGWSISTDRVFVWYNWLMLDELDITAGGGAWSVGDGVSAGVATADIKFVWYNWLMLLELDDSDDVLRKYSWGLDLAGQAGQLNSLEGAGGIGGLVGVRNLGESPAPSYIYFCDGNGNVVQAINRSSDTIDAKYEYDAYGNNLLDASDSNESGPFADANPFRFSTKYYEGEHDDAATVANEGTYSYIFRDYWPRLGRWGSEDPMGERGGVNLLTYLRNRTIDRFDPAGLKTYVIEGTWSGDGRLNGPCNAQRFGEDDPSGSFIVDGVGGPLGGLFGLGTAERAERVRSQICEDMCSESPPDQINIVARSRGAIFALLVVDSLNKYGCCCQWKKVRATTGPIITTSTGPSAPSAEVGVQCCDRRYPSINFLGLYDPVDMRFAGHPQEIPPNVQNCALAIGEEKRRATTWCTYFGASSHRRSWLYPLAKCEPANWDKTKFNRRYFDGSHGDIGAGQEADDWMRKCARAAGVNIPEHGPQHVPRSGNHGCSGCAH